MIEVQACSTSSRASVLSSENKSLEVENDLNVLFTGHISLVINTSGRFHRRRGPASNFQELVKISSFQFQLSLLPQVVSHVDEVPLHWSRKL